MLAIRTHATSASVAALVLMAASAGCKKGNHTEASSSASSPSASAPAPSASDAASSPSAPASAPAASVVPPAPEGMAYIEGAAFDAVMGDGSVAPTTVRGFFIDEEKVTNGAFKQCYDDRACLVAVGSLDFLKPNLAGGPVTDRSLSEARAFCKSVGKRLPTTAEWQLAARGKEGRVYPWGNEAPEACTPPDCKAVRIKTPQGLIGMAGVLWEMSDADVCFVKAAKPELCTQKAAVIHGGAWSSPATAFKSLEVQNASSVPSSTVSFRCAKDAE